MAVDLTRMLQLVIDKHASELRLESGQPPGVVLGKNLRRLNVPPLTPGDTRRFLARIATEACLREFEEKGACEFGLPFKGEAHFFVRVTLKKGACALRLNPVPKKRPEKS